MKLIKKVAAGILLAATLIGGGVLAAADAHALPDDQADAHEKADTLLAAAEDLVKSLPGLTTDEVTKLGASLESLREQVRSEPIPPFDPQAFEAERAAYSEGCNRMEELDAQQAKTAFTKTNLMVLAGALGLTAVVTAIVMIVRKRHKAKSQTESLHSCGDVMQ